MDNVTFTKNGARIIQNEIREALENGKHEITVTGCYEIEDAIVLPSHFTVRLKDCHLRQKDGVYANIFTNASTVQDERTVEKRDYGIRIIGEGNAVLDGGVFNGLTERNWAELGISMQKNHLIFFTNLEDFKISGLHLMNQRYWSVNLTYCSFGEVSDIEITADDSILYVDGERDYDIDYRGLCAKHLPMLRNADGIDVRVGCHDIHIENIKGFTEDDTVAITGLAGAKPSPYTVEGLSSDIYNITVKNIRSSSWCAIVRLLNQGGIKLYNILVDGVVDTSKNSPHMNRGLFGVRVGDRRLYSTRHSTSEETFNIVVRNVFSRAETIVDMAGAINGAVIENIFGFDGYGKRIENNAELCGTVRIEE